MRRIAIQPTLLSQVSSVALFVSLTPGIAQAQQATAPTTSEQAAPASDEITGPVASDIVVTASRVNRQGYSAPTPTVVVGGAQLEQKAATNIGQYLLTEVPAFRPTTQPTSNGANQRSNGSNYLDLRGLGTSRTLVLVDGNRFVPEMAAGLAGYNVNLNQIPALLVDRVEVVTGGASAQWGSDAVAGVVNILLKKNFNGFQAEAQGGTSTHGDNRSLRFGFLAGKDFADGRVNLTVSADYEKNYGVGDVNTRDWGRSHVYLIPNPCPGAVAVSATCPAGGNGLASRLILPDVQFSTATPGGIINSTVLKGTNFGPGGTTSPFSYGQYVGPTYMIGGGQPGVYFPAVQQIAAPFRRMVLYGRGSVKLSDFITAHGELSYSKSDGGGQSVPYVSSLTIRKDNAYLSDSIKNQMTDAGLTSFTFGRYNTELATFGHLENQTTRWVLGLDGAFAGGGDWKWNANVGHGVNNYKQAVDNNTIVARYGFAADAVLNNGQIVCRATIAGSSFNAAAAGCVPMNVFGTGAITDAARAYVAGVSMGAIDYRQTFFNASLSGKPFETWAGPVSVATGVEYRYESESAWSDPIAQANGYQGNNSATFSGVYEVKEAFVETVVPLLKDSPLGESLEINGAARYADYKGAAGGQVTWKAGLTYNPFAGMLLRAARSRDIRAPNIFERSVPPSGRSATIQYGSAVRSLLVLSSGNPNLKPEKADTTTFGFSYQPPFVPGLAFSVDHFKIGTKGLITTLAGQDVADFCRVTAEPLYCGLITFDTGGLPTAISTPFLNLASVRISGLDFQASYRFPLSRVADGLGGSLQLSFAGTYTRHAQVNSGLLNAPTIDRSGELGPRNQFAVPRFRSTTSLTYSDERLSLGLSARQVSGGKYDVTYTAADINNNDVEGRTYFDLSARFKVAPGITLFGVVTNLLDTDPPAAPTDNASPTNAVYFDTIGRVIKGGIRVEM
ncbi:TonB-dependent receptor [Novosphingobium flavum]|uniref:TonB-dependent receptor n=1 Tax=Novosphingobium flavum TaxID=1778672 RepID=A0A7X1FTL4_9SPHN|nr:TonB-dependent receptor [Novosphingobium flavum]MBC2666728.1 TonB-dependent receptor [Novosphingobium flavum]